MNIKKTFAKFIGDRAFYSRVLLITIPIMVQNGISNFVNLLDNIMVGRIGTEQMSGVAIVNHLVFVFYLCIFGGFAGAGIFTAQYYGKGDYEGIKQTFRYKLLLGFFILAATFAIFKFHGSDLIMTFLMGDRNGGDPAATFGYAEDYLHILLFSLIPLAIVQVYANTLRECSQTIVPMKAGLLAVFVNLVLNYLLIYGKLGFPCMGVKGAAWATVTARYAEMLIVVVWAHTHPERCPYLKGVYSTLAIPLKTVKRIFLTGIPLLINETLWASGVTMLAQCYSMRGLNVIAAYNILGVISNVFNVVFFSMGDAIAIIVGQHLGAGDMKRARDDDNKIIALAIFISVIVAIIIAISAPFFPRLYNTNEDTRRLAAQFLLAQAVFTPQIAFLHTSYFTVRAGGRTLITFLFDSFFMLCVNVPLAFVLSRFTDLHVIRIFALVQISDWIKCIIGFVLVKKGTWMRNITRS